ncbi:hypothetical protein [Haloplanus sp. C73]|uniref:hypothetical protein n=1 Tax=Haloplanus sp. C73 TaxID=3421641 RepID=UPI003EC0A665
MAGHNGLWRGVAESIAQREALPTPMRAILGYYADSGQLSVSALRLQRATDQFMTRAVADLFDPVEDAIASEIDAAPDAVEFEYDTKLTLPAELTLGQVYYRARRETPDGFDPVNRELTGLRARLGGDEKRLDRLRDAHADRLDTIERAERMTELVTAALVDGDMRDALNDAEYEDFHVDFPVASEKLRREIAACAQRTLQRVVDERFEAFPPAVREAYDRAVDISERHQEKDERFRELARRAREGDSDAVDAIEAEYKFADFDSPPPMFDASDLELPYLKTQYRRVGVIYRGMIEMYRAADIDVDTAFEKSIIFAIIGAQVWLDDVDDYDADYAEDQLTPVTAEYLLEADDETAYRNVVDISQTYLDAAKAHAEESNSPLAGIGSDYIYRSGDPSVLPQ